MRNKFDEQLEMLHTELIEMGALCEKAIDETLKVLMNGDTQTAQSIMKEDNAIDLKERDIESLCLKLLLQQQPVARDLRTISSALKMISDMERIGDQASDIAEIAGYVQNNSVVDHTHLKAMAEAATEMVVESIKSFVNRDLDLAHKVMKDDDIVDAHFDEVKKDIIELIRKGEAGAEFCLDLLMIAKYLERIGDHAVNVAEWVEFSITGEHLSEELRNK